MRTEISWQNVVIICTGVMVLGAILITALLNERNGVVLAGGMTIIGSVLTGAATFNLGRRSLQKKIEETQESKEVPKTPSSDSM